MKKFLLAAVILAAGAAWSENNGGAVPIKRLAPDPYGVCCHISRGWAGEWDDRALLFGLESATS